MTEGKYPQRRIAFRVEYDGTHYHGWQSQPGVMPTLQGTIEDALSTFFGRVTAIQGASRTDAGVHALDQVAATTIEHPISTTGFVKAINHRLPPDISIRSAQEVELTFNPRFENHGKMYCYKIYEGKIRRPLLDRTHWRIPWLLDIDAIGEASLALQGTHDFASFVASDGQHKTTQRTIEDITWTRVNSSQHLMTIRGTAFLKHMVRNIVGTLVDIGRGHRPPASIPAILDACQRSAAGPTAPSSGLVLQRVYMHYDEQTDLAKPI
ncbi:MAG: tRNA pseudouridine(38-40) synthase TruA [Myxococcota bacterium]|nr:tRNA pseudouridine(38-40) synthase TruA [Myxococcota bacterium]